MGDINSENSRGFNSAYADSSPFNAYDAQINSYVNGIDTLYLARIESCSTPKEKGSKTVRATPLTMITDAEGNTYKSPPYVELPHTRYQYGIAAIIIDPVPGDRVLMGACKRDISTIGPDTTEPQQPGSFRAFDPADSILIGAVHTKDPTNWVWLGQDDTCHRVHPEGILTETNKNIQQEVGQDVIQHIGRDRTETIGQHREVTISGNDTLKVTGNQDKTVNGNVSINIDGNGNVTIKGNATITVQGTATIKATGAVTVESAATVTVKAPLITLDAQQTTCTGNLGVKGTLNVSGGGSGGTSSVTGTLKVSQDVTGGGISLKGHKHSGVHGNTSGPL